MPFPMDCDQSTIETLPSEILDTILASFPTPALLPIAAVSRRFHGIVEDLLDSRMRRAVSTHKYHLLLEAYHPSARSLTPVMACSYEGTDGFGDGRKAQRTPAAARRGGGIGTDTNMAALLGAYSHFQIHPQEDMWTQYRRARRGSMSPMAPALAVSAAALSALGVSAAGVRRRQAAQAAHQPQPAFHGVVLDEGERFSQLCTATHLARGSAQHNHFLSCGTVNATVVRVFRDWLAQADVAAKPYTAAARMPLHRLRTHESDTETNSDSDSEVGLCMRRTGLRPSKASEASVDPDQRILWTDYDKTVGIRFRVTERALPEEHHAYDHDQGHGYGLGHTFGRPADKAVAYTLEYEELVVRTYQLLLSIEAAEA